MPTKSHWPAPENIDSIDLGARQRVLFGRVGVAVGVSFPTGFIKLGLDLVGLGLVLPGWDAVVSRLFAICVFFR